ncbi:MAG: 2-isopropylmalate synthase [Parcubacteria group bacterium GW2011_GWA2_47_16]|nr:MAG: 2-isopropylmalate synthase [Parcubacteria group bacterium GW2011_GWA2_47_16]
MNLKEKLEVAYQLEELGVDVIEAGFPVISDGDFAAVLAIARKIKGPKICALARCRVKDIRAAGKAIKPAGRRGRIHVFLASSKIHREFKLKMTQEEIIRLAVRSVKYALSYGVEVQFSPEDGSRTEYDFLLQLCRAVVKAGATILNIPDTVGWSVPEQYGELIGKLIRDIPECQSGKVIISAHCHDDLGLATANALAAIKAGARQVEGTINGIGERAGNTALEEIIAAIDTRRDYFKGMWTGVNTREILDTSRLVARMTGLMVQRSKAIVGENAFAHAAGIHQDGVMKKRETYEIMNARRFGWKGNSLPLSKHSSRKVLLGRVERLGFKVAKSGLPDLFARFKTLGDRKKLVYDEDLTALLSGQVTKALEVWSLELLQVSTGTNGFVPTATVRLCSHGRKRSLRGKVVRESGTGDGAVDAALKTIDRLTGTKGRLKEYVTRLVSAGNDGKDALGEAILKVDFGNGELVNGRGVATDVVEASARAYLDAVNRFLANGKA